MPWGGVSGIVSYFVNGFVNDRTKTPFLTTLKHGKNKILASQIRTF